MGQFRRTFLLKQFVPARRAAAAIGGEGGVGVKISSNTSFPERNGVKYDHFSTNQTQSAECQT